MSRKPSPGVCGICGRARVRPDSHAVIHRLETEWRDFWIDGHYYELSGRLLEVRCVDHEPKQEYDWW